MSEFPKFEILADGGLALYFEGRRIDLPLSAYEISADVEDNGYCRVRLSFLALPWTAANET